MKNVHDLFTEFDMKTNILRMDDYEIRETYFIAGTIALEKQHQEILEYCRPHTDQMWAANIVSIILGCDFRDATPTLAKYFMEIEK
jgi:hypothetical protein